MQMKYTTGLMWFRRDLRVEDNAALHHALKSCQRVFCVFVFDRDILNALPGADRRVEFIRESLVDLSEQLRRLAQENGTADAGLLMRHDKAIDAIPALAARLSVDAVFTNHDDEPQALARDASVQALLEAQGVAFHSFKDHVIFERSEVLTLAGKPYSVFTPYKNAWLKKIDDFYLKPYPVEKYASALAALPAEERHGIPSLQALGFKKTNLSVLKIPTGSQGGTALFDDFLSRMAHYKETRDFPAVKGPSYLGVHLRFGTDMVTASFLVKGLGIDWRWGERYFAEKLNDFDLSANNGGWQWAASTGCDAQPYFRIFNPVSQSEKFDAEGKFIRKYLPVLEKLSTSALHSPWLANPVELAAAGVTLGNNYPMPIVQHNEARALTLQRYPVGKQSWPRFAIIFIAHCARKLWARGTFYAERAISSAQ
ncbi:DNA photolyase family protein [Polaromonas sp. P2-4]|nr:DNA photolyase family protein [Polaromonas sp. P2-4]